MLHPLNQLLPPVTRFLWSQLCDVADPRADSGSRFRSEEIVAEASRQGVLGLLNAWTQSTPTFHLPSDVLKAHLGANAVRSLALVNEALKVSKLLEGDGLRHIFVKGPFLAQKYYGDFGIRDAGDLDVLVDELDVPRAVLLLRDAGYVRTKPVRDLTPRRWKLYLDTQHEFGFERRRLLIELHWRFADCRRLQSAMFPLLWERSRHVSIGAHSFRTLGAGDTFIHLAIHGALAGWSMLKWIADLGRVRKTFTAADEQLVSATMANPALSRVLELAHCLGPNDGSESRPWLEPVFRRIATNLINVASGEPSALNRLQSFVTSYRYQFHLVPGLRNRLAMLRSNLIMPADFDRSDLPDRLTPLLPLVAQVRRGIDKLLL